MNTFRMLKKSIFLVFMVFVCIYILTACRETVVPDITFPAEESNKTTSNISVTKETQTEEITVPQTITFSEFNYAAVDSVYVVNGISGEKVTLTDSAQIADVIALIQRISGSAPVSSRGYYGFYYYVTLKKGADEFITITFVPENLPGEYAFNYGIFSIKNGHLYSCRYTMSGIVTDDILNLFGAYFG